jgi:hypothetical protein
MIRESDNPSARHAMMALTNDQGAAFQRRIQNGGDSDNTQNSDIRAPYWVKLERKGSELTGSISPDGITWRPVDHVTIDLPKDSLMGLAVTAHNNSAKETAVFDHVEVRATQRK